MAAPNSNLPSWAQGGSGGGAQSTAGNSNLPSWAQNGSGGTVVGSTSEFATVPKKSKGQSGIGGFFHHVGHVVADKADKAVHDIKAIPVGGFELAKAAVAPGDHPSWSQVGQEWKDLLHGKLHTNEDPLAKQVIGMAKASKETVEHPLRDPFMTLLTLAPAVHGLGKVVDEGIAAKTGTRLTDQPRFLKQGEGKPVALHGSKNPSARLAQAGYDKVLQRGLDKNPEGRIAAHAEKRIHGSLAETQRFRQHMREVPANELDASAKQLGSRRKLPGGFSARQIQQRALRMTSEQYTPEEAIHFHVGQAEDGVGVKKNLKQAALYKAIHEADVIHLDHEGKVVINEAKYPKLAQVDKKIEAGAKNVDRIAVRYGEMTPQGVRTRLNAPGRHIHGDNEESRAMYDAQLQLHRRNYAEDMRGLRGKETALNRQASKASVLRENLQRVQSQIAELHPIHEKANEYLGQMMHSGFETRGEGMRAYRPLVQQQEHVGRLDSQLSRLRDRESGLKTKLAALEEHGVPNDQIAEHQAAVSSQIKQQPGLLYEKLKSVPVPGATARPGRNFVTYETSVPKEGGPVSSSVGSVVGKPRAFIRSKPFKAEGLDRGRVPDNTVHLTAQNMRAAFNHVNTDEFRHSVLETGSDVRRSKRDVLVRVPDKSAEALSEEHKLVLGKAKSTEDTIGEARGFQAYLQDMIPHWTDKSVEAQDIGTKAPEGYKWVSKNVLGDLGKPLPGASSKIGRAANEINSAVTAATVYFKLGHVGTRVLTNASTAILQGSAAPLEIAKSVKLWKQLSWTERHRALAAAGQKGFEALPQEGQLATARMARWGAKQWAKYADAPFRFASLAFEARRAGFKTPAEFRQLLDDLENPHLDAAHTAKVQWVANHANRAGIAYDRLNSAEKRVITKGVWFYPWVKGSTLFTGHTFVEHPYKTALAGGASQIGQQAQAKELGALPSYEYGLIPLGHGSHPTVSDFSTFSPFATGADVAEAALSRPGNLSGFLNPVAGAALSYGTSTDAFGNKTNSPVTAALSTLLAPTPEAQLYNAIRNQHNPKQSTKMFPMSPADELKRYGVGPAMPRRVTKRTLNKAAGLEKKGASH